jgi:FolB domain-containing protein
LASDDSIELSGIRLRCIVGIYPSERVHRQLLEVDLTLRLDLRRAQSGGLASSVDYARVVGDVSFLLERGRFRTLEAAGEALARLLLTPAPPELERASLEQVTVAIAKPEALQGIAIPRLRLTRDAAECRPTETPTDFGTREALWSEQVSLERWRLNPGASTTISQPNPSHLLALSRGLTARGEPLKRGTALALNPDESLTLHNPLGSHALLLCLTERGRGDGWAPRQTYYPVHDEGM